MRSSIPVLHALHAPLQAGKRHLLGAALWALLGPRSAQALPLRRLQFPQDHGAHPDLRTEWWYLTGALQAGARSFGFQLTFFRTRVAGTQGMQSAFAAKQLLFAHAAITDVQGRRLWHDQRIARQGFGLAQAAQDDTAIALYDWQLVRAASQPGAPYMARMHSADFAFQLQCRPTQGVLLQGQDGLSRKGPLQSEASYYYSQPQLQTQGQLRLGNQRFAVAGSAWLDHEWSQAMLAPQAAGWDWIGMNLLDGGALMAFRIRLQADASQPLNDGNMLWDGGAYRSAQGVLRVFQPGEVVFTALRYWVSPASGARYPVEWTVQTPLAHYSVKAVIDAQELDSRASTGAIYWEGLSTLHTSQGLLAGRGYLEMTGYAGVLRL